MPSITEAVSFSSHGVLPAIVQDYDTGEVIVFGYMNPEALEKTAETGLTHLYNRQEKDLKPYGEDSGRVQHVKSIHLSKDSDSILIKVTQSFPPDQPRPRSKFNLRWRPESSSWVEESERGFTPQPSTPQQRTD